MNKELELGQSLENPAHLINMWKCNKTIQKNLAVNTKKSIS